MRERERDSELVSLEAVSRLKIKVKRGQQGNNMPRVSGYFEPNPSGGRFVESRVTFAAANSRFRPCPCRRRHRRRPCRRSRLLKCAYCVYINGKLNRAASSHNIEFA